LAPLIEAVRQCAEVGVALPATIETVGLQG
jgi:hypothetical protein